MAMSASRIAGYAKIIANIADSSDALFTPCTYKLKDVSVVKGPQLSPITEIVSFRGRFCEQATVGEKIEVQGKVEHVTNSKNGDEYYRLIIGNKPSDYMVLRKSEINHFSARGITICCWCQLIECAQNCRQKNCSILKPLLTIAYTVSFALCCLASFL